MLIPDLLDKEGVSVTMGSRSGNSDSWREDHRAFMQLIDNDPGTSLSTLVTGDEGMHLWHRLKLIMFWNFVGIAWTTAKQGSCPPVGLKVGNLSQSL